MGPSLYPLPPALAAAAALSLGFFVLARLGLTRVSAALFGLTVLIAGWLGCFALAHTAADDWAALAWVRAGSVATALLPAAAYQFAVLATGAARPRRQRAVAAWMVGLGFALLAVGSTSWIAGVRRFWWGPYPVYGALGAPFVVFLVGVIVLALSELRRDRHRSQEEPDRARSRALLIAMATGVLAVIDFVPAFGVGLYPFGWAAILAFTGLSAAVVSRYGIPDPASMAGEVQFRALAESASDAIASINSRGDLTYVNRAAARIFGTGHGALTGRPAASFLATEFHERWGDFLSHMLATGQDPLLGETTELVAVRDDGQTFPVEVSLGSWKGVDGTFFTAILRDIGERKGAEAALRASEEKFRAVLESSAAAVFIIDEGRVLYANEAASALASAPAAELLEHPFLDRFHVDSHDIVRHRVLRAPSPAVAGLRYEARLAGGDDRWVELTGRALDFAGRSARLVTAFDVTERRRAEEAMRESERRMRDILENVQLVAVLLDRGGVITYCNPFFLELVGYEEEDVIGREWFAAFVAEEDREAGRATLRDRMQLGAVAAHEETAIVTRHGDRRVVAGSNTVLRDWTGDVTGAASIGADVTDRRRAEDQLQHDAFHDA
ncbi:MAG TPA: PAS domain S-box protein, partial [Vicinamibacteria bacterium]|nr:PAS domain S-box protein [Vicinamibacteria bacterium]